MLKRLQNSNQSASSTEDQGDEPDRQTAGQFLCETREKFGYDLRDVSEQLRIRHVYLVAIEDDRLDDLPGATYAVGFVRAYAEFLGLNGPAMVERFKEETAELAKAARLVFPSPQSEGKIPSGAILLMSVLVMALGYGGWVYLSSKDRPIAELVPALPESFMSLIGQGDSESDEVSPESEAQAGPVEAVPTESESKPEPEPEPEMPAVTAAPVQPVVVDTSERPNPPEEPVAETEASAETAAETEDTATGQPTPETEVAAVSDQVSQVAAAVESLPETTPAETTETVLSPRDPSEAAGTVTTNAPLDAQADSVREVATDVPVPAPATPEPAIVAAVVTDGSPPITPETDPASNSGTEPGQPDVDVVALPAPPAPPVIDTDKPRRYGAENVDSRIVLRASDEVWVQVRDSAGNLLLTRLLRTGDTYRVPNDPGLVMRTGNAGGLDILVDGNPIPRIGSKGDVLKEVALDADLLKAGRATPQ